MESHGIWKAQKSANPVSMFFFFKEENSPSFSMLQKNKTGLAFSCGFVHFGLCSLSGCVTEIHECDRLGKRRRLRATRRNNSQLCRASDVGSCSVRVGSGVQTDATTPNIVGPTMLGVVAFVLAVVSKRTQQLPTTYNRVCKRTQHVTSNNIGSWGPYNNVASVCPGLYKEKAGKTRRHFLPVNFLVSYLLRLRRKYPVLLKNWDLLG